MLTKGRDEIDKEEVRCVCSKTLETLQLVYNDAMEAQKKKLNETQMMDAVREALIQYGSLTSEETRMYEELIQFISKMAEVLLEIDDEDIEFVHKLLPRGRVFSRPI